MRLIADDVISWVETHSEVELTKEQKRALRMIYAGATRECDRTPPGWTCTRGSHIGGPCALTPRRWNLLARRRAAR